MTLVCWGKRAHGPSRGIPRVPRNPDIHINLGRESPFAFRVDFPHVDRESPRNTAPSFPTDPEFLHRFVQRRPADAKFRGGGSDLPSVAPQGVLDHLPFHAFPRLLQRLRRQGTQGTGRTRFCNSRALPGQR